MVKHVYVDTPVVKTGKISPSRLERKSYAKTI